MLPDLTFAEQKALEATKLESFPVNLEEIRRTVAQLLSEFGRYNIFNEYTTHSFDHVFEMLRSLDWLIPEGTKTLLTKGDWWLITLACYFHDLGLVVTRSEYEKRGNSSFSQFCQQTLFSGSNGEDYKSKLDELPDDQKEKFLYQEFVRANHAARVRAWIMGEPKVDLGQAEALAKEIDRLLLPLDERVRSDLANVCESHNLSDFADDRKYPVFQAYGQSNDETVSVQYAAVILRTVDLIQITKQRAPTVLYKVINPTDPISQIEWLKQNAVRHLRPQPKRDRSGVVDPAVQADTIEVFADFKKAEGFFGLTSYLQYAEKELQASYAAIEKSKKNAARKLFFPWRYIDDRNIRTEGFIPQKYEFELDQAKILDLLTGHTLYNNSGVVVRELAQNAIDAVRLQSVEDSSLSDEVGQVEIVWNEASSALVIRDNGTGMTQDIIEKHLLKVGSSRYQDQKFKEDHPDFSPISRFGIGVLSAFMVADTVEILTCNTKEDEARQISLRSVHGNYLIRLIKKSNAEAKDVYPHGTKITLRLRASATKVDVLEEVRKWITIPRCRVSVKINDEPEIIVGYKSPKEALEQYLAKYGEGLLGEKATYKVLEYVSDGLTVAYALSKDQFFRNWSFIELPRDEPSFLEDDAEEHPAFVRTCVQGISVEFSSPGFRREGIVALANATGKNAPKTNVARSSIENTQESADLTQNIYKTYALQIGDETRRLMKEEQFSLSRAMNEIPFIAHPFTRQREVRLERPELFDQALAELPIFLLEDEQDRRAVSLDELTSLREFWCVISPLDWSIEHLIGDMPIAVTSRQLYSLGKDRITPLPSGAVVANINFSDLTFDIIQQRFEISRMVASEKDRRVDLKWCLKPTNPIWFHSQDIGNKLNRSNYRTWYALSSYFQARSRDSFGLFLPIEGLEVDGLKGYSAVEVLGQKYLLPERPLTNFLLPLLKCTAVSDLARCFIYLRTVESMLASRWLSDFDRMLRELAVRDLDQYVPDWKEFAAAAVETNIRKFNPFAWSRHEVGDSD